MRRCPFITLLALFSFFLTGTVSAQIIVDLNLDRTLYLAY